MIQSSTHKLIYVDNSEVKKTAHNSFDCIFEI